MGRLGQTLAVAALLSSACSSRWLPTTAAVDGQTIAYRQRGDGKPVVVLANGLGASAERAWGSIFDDLATHSTVLAYHRAGYPGSELGDCPRRGSPSDPLACNRTGAQAVEELRALLRAARVPPPFVLVGHSLGGMHMELFARTYPDEVAGLVLVDSRHHSVTRRCEEAGYDFCHPPKWAWLFASRTIRAEFRGLEETEQQLRVAPAMRDIPLVVITGMRDKRDIRGVDARAQWLETQKLLAAQSSQSSHIVSERSGHAVQDDEPLLVIGAVAELLARTRAAPPKRFSSNSCASPGVSHDHPACRSSRPSLGAPIPAPPISCSFSR